MQIASLMEAIAALIKFVSDQLGESTADVKKRVLAELRKDVDDETDVVSSEIDADMPGDPEPPVASDR